MWVDVQGLDSEHVLLVDIRPNGKLRRVRFPAHPGWSIPALAATYSDNTPGRPFCICTDYAWHAMQGGDEFLDAIRDWFAGVLGLSSLEEQRATQGMTQEQIERVRLWDRRLVERFNARDDRRKNGDEKVR